MPIDLARSLREIKPGRRRAQLRVRAPHSRLSASRAARVRQLLLPDTCVYIDNAAGRLPAAIQLLIDGAIQFHCAVCLGEIALGLGNADPSVPAYQATIKHYTSLVSRVPPTRLLVPDDDIWATAGLMAGTLARTQGYQRSHRKELLNDALIYLTAAKTGLPVLTRNHDFDLLWQLRPTGAVMFY